MNTRVGCEDIHLWLVSAVNNSMAVWEMSPVATVIEERVIRWMCDLVGYGPRASGTFTSGGTEATFTALLAARAEKYPNVWREGWDARRPPVVVHGEHAHYAVQRAAGAMGLGTDNCVSVGSTPEFKMDPVKLAAVLERLQKDGREVLAVVATAGCTAVGAFDDLEAVARERDSSCAVVGLGSAQDDVDAVECGDGVGSGWQRPRAGVCSEGAVSISWRGVGE